MPKTKIAPSSATIGFEAKLWLAADKLRNNMDAAIKAWKPTNNSQSRLFCT